jgi:hypothetical protein
MIKARERFCSVNMPICHKKTGGVDRIDRIHRINVQSLFKNDHWHVAHDGTTTGTIVHV